MVSSQVKKPLKHGGKRPVMGNMYWDLWERTEQIHNPGCAGVERRRDKVRESSERRWYLSEPGEVKWEANSST